MRDIFQWLSQFFLNYFWVGVALILGAISADKYFPAKTFIESVGISFVETVGIAVLVASVFSFASGTSQFNGKVRSLLKEIVIDRDFLGNIDADGKQIALAALIKPSEAERQVYADIGRYYDTYIKHTTSITKKCVRSEFSCVAVVLRDEGTSKVVSRISISYRLHPTVEGYGDITIRLDEKDLGSDIVNLRVSTPDGKRIYNDKPVPEDEEHRGNKNGKAIIPLSDIGKGYSHLKIEVEVVEKGHDHWIMQNLKALEPTDGFRFKVECRDDLRIVAQNTFAHGAKFYVDRPDEKSILFSCDEWVNEGTGIAVVVSGPESNQMSKAVIQERGA